MNPALSRVNQERRAFPSQSVAESSWQKSMWFCLIMINVFTYFIILQAIFFFFQFFILLEDDLAIATHKPESLVLYHLIAYQQEDATSSGMWLILNFHFLELHSYQNTGVMFPGTRTAKLGIVITGTILWLTHRTVSVTLIFIEKHLRKNYSHVSFSVVASS